ncbi:dihydrofolate reductase [bacterium SCSIO 12696]|nr:dihydrofolate reductase [bacterium SCSIO 12696]
MKNLKILSLAAAVALVGCDASQTQQSAPATAQPASEQAQAEQAFVWQTEQFADLKILRYQIPDWDRLSLQQKKLAYYLTQAGYEGRDIFWDQNYRHNLAIRHALEAIVRNYNGDKSAAEWQAFMTYTKRVWFSNGIHHHYSMDKFIPEFSRDYFVQLLQESGASLNDGVLTAMFDPAVDAKKVSLDPSKDLLLASATNFYGPDITQAEAEAYYAAKIDKADPEPISYGLNSKLVRNANGELEEKVWHLNGMYGEAIAKIIPWLEKAVTVAENPAQADALKLLIEYYRTGDLKTWDAYNIAWAGATEGDIDYIHSFIEVYNDPMGYRGSFENIVEVNDFAASEQMAVVANNAQWFEDQSPIDAAHKKENVVGISYKVVSVAGEAGDASPSTPIGVNLPNANWIRAKHGSKSVSLGNIVAAYDEGKGKGLLEEFSFSEDEVKRAKTHGRRAGKLMTSLHEVIGHASGKLNPGVGTPKETLKNYASALEEARADLVALYYITDPKLVEIGVLDSMEVGKAAYENYIRNGLMLQLRRLEPGAIIEQAHMRNRHMVSSWVLEKGAADKVVERKVVDGKTYFVVNDYDKLRTLFGQLLNEIQRIKSEGDYDAGRNLIETYGVQVDESLHSEVLARSEELNIAPYGGFINPRLVPVIQDHEIADIKVEYPDDFTQQMLDYGERYSNLPLVN